MLLVSADDTEKLVGGHDAQPGQFPYTVSIRYQDSHICGGSIISDHHVLTAAHCVKDLINYINDVSVVTGTIYLDRGGEFHRVANMFAHPQYNGYTSVDNDVGVVKLTLPIVFNAYQRLIPLPTADPPANNYAVVSAWGGTASPPNDTLSNVQQYLYLWMISLDECKEYKNLDVQTDAICTYDGVGIGLCPGDSGSPLVYNNQVVGVVSRGVPCARGEPDVFTDVYDTLDFIREAMLY
ncbi:chymotrypsin-1-like [Colletes latitarsis]|uniref:chymotrypsin-1-like n=1 Tax=Colletes latitarsis TaxID=2605962 RepID=UPI0040366622